MLSQDTHRLTSGSIFKSLLKFAMPALGSHLLMSLYGTADVLIVSHFADASALAATAIGAQAVFTLMALAMGLIMGGTILIGQYFGAKRDTDVKDIIGTFFVLFFYLGIFSSVIMLALANTITDWLQTPLPAWQGTRNYILICGGGLIFTFAYESISGVLRGLGDSKNPLKFVAIACFFNVLLDLLFVGYFKLGASGAATATVIAQAISAVLAVLYLKHKQFIFDFKPKSFKFFPDKAKMILKLGIPAAIQHSFVFMSFTIMTVIVNKLGLVEAATFGITNRIDGFLIIPVIAFASAISVMAAQNMGAGLISRTNKIYYTGLLMGLFWAVPAFILMYFYPDKLMRLVSSDPDIIKAGDIFLYAYSLDALFMAIVFCTNGFLNGCGQTTFTMTNNIITSLFFRIPFVLWASNLFEVGLSMPASTLPQIIIALTYFYMGYWKKTKIVQKEVTYD